MASLQARHSRSCAIGRPWTSFDDATKARGCTCAPMYHVAFRRNGKLERKPVGQNRREAERALDVMRGDLASRRYRVTKDIRFDAWADEWLERRRHSGTKTNTVRVYEDTLAYAKHVFGHVKVRDLEPRDMSRLLDHVRAQHDARQAHRKPEERTPVSNATLAKHLRQVGACLNGAVKEGYATENPVGRMLDRPRVERSDPSYFTDGELARLWPELAERPVYGYLCKLALATGMRSGELLALRWSDVDLLTREVRVQRTYVVGVGETATKSGKARTVDLAPQAATLLEEWFKASGDEGLVFAKETGGHIDANYVLKRVLYPAMSRAGVERVGEHGGKRDFHSFRHTFARVTLEAGTPIVWVQQALGHSNITLTVDTYGRWGRAAQQAQAEKLEGAFPI